MSALNDLRQQWQAQSRQWLDRYEALLPREQLIVAVGAVVVLLTLVYLLLWEPAAKARQYQQAALADERALAERLETIGAAVQRARATGNGVIQGQEQSLLTLVDQQGKAPELGKPPSRLQPDGDAEVKVWFEDVPFDGLVRWLSILETRFGVHVIAAELERRAGNGLVNARLSLSRSP